MRIVMRDGRVFQGTAVQIVQAMKNIAFGADGMSLDEYMTWVVDNAQRFDNVAIALEGDTTEARASTLVEGMVSTGLARR